MVGPEHIADSDGVGTADTGETSGADLKSLTQAFELFARTTQAMEESYRMLEERVESMDKELESKNRELAHTTEYLNSILDSMSDGVIAVDPDGVITTFNCAAQMILDYPASRLVGTPFSDVFEREFSTTELAASELRTRDGTSVPVSERNAPIAGKTDLTRGMVKVFQDLREVESLREQVRRKDRLAVIGEMAATVAHEIRNPLGGIRGFASLLERDIGEGDPRLRLVKKILLGTKNLERVVNELLEYTRPVQLRTSSVSCRKLLDGAIGLLDLSDGRVTIRRNIEPSIAVIADHEKVVRALFNVLLNGVQSIEGEGEIVISCGLSRSTVDIVIADSGSGISEEGLEKVFSPFYTTKERGTGLGLASAAKTIESHGGEISVFSTLGAGSTFTIRLNRGPDG